MQPRAQSPRHPATTSGYHTQRCVSSRMLWPSCTALHNQKQNLAPVHSALNSAPNSPPVHSTVNPSPSPCPYKQRSVASHKLTACCIRYQ
eukprot:7005938-Pyramimonas_sp.AAC.1